MNPQIALFLEQTFNGIQFGMLLFLMAVGVTLVFGVMRVVNLAHGSMFMLGAFMAATGYELSGSYAVGLIGGVVGASAVALLVELAIIRPLYRSSHLDQILATFGLTLLFNEAVAMIWGKDPQYLSSPELLSGAVELLPGLHYPAYRLAITIVSITLGAGLYWLLARTRIGMLIRAGADDRNMVAGLGVNIATLYSIVFVLGAALASIAGILIGPIGTIQSGMGDPILVLALTVVVIGGIGSVGGALVASLLVGVFDTYGRIYLPILVGAGSGSALANMLIYLIMAVVVTIRPSGLFARR